MKRALFGLAGLLVIAGSAVAGYKAPTPVYVSATWAYASGALGGARNSADTTQLIECYTQSNPGDPVATCAARDSAGNWGICSTIDPRQMDVIGSMDSTSYVTYNWGKTGECTFIRADHDSWTEPKK